ncbi:response regulator [Marinomonas sp. C2222]|uniref:Response regulator n=1 Tax=Marinomonas sargassi TaxID=2984494 RepID=A0ABT2YTV8_9GAMM|nr:response regulator [Marinomonas sargassi]MCV2403333.1 response regulator [Marinomonas sargassi]
MSTESSTADLPLTVLCVDDEVNILKSMKRLLHKQGYQILLAESGAKALALMKEHDVHLIMSDMKMPSMTGAQLLEQVATSYPETYRILLTGYSDMESTVDAVNKGKIHRYLQKPWDNDEIIEAISEGLQQVKLKHENIKLQGLIKKQNSLLKGLNQTLEDKIKLRTKQINAAMKKVEQNNIATQKVLFNLISINPHLSGSYANSISLLSKRIAEKLSLPKKEIKEISFAASLCEIGLLGMDTAVYSQSFGELDFDQKQEYQNQTIIAQLILSPAAHMQDVSDIITCQFEHFNGSGPNRLTDEQIPLGARILAVARDYWRYRLARITREEIPDAEVKLQMKKFMGVRYDPEILGILIDNPEIVSSKYLEKPIKALSIKAGMVLKYSVFTEKDILVLPEGHVFTNESITKLLQFEKQQATPFTVIIEEQKVEEEKTED